ncbi:(d)CMP kinase [Orrella sp. NBD-18]|uniref:Cytidylate kinase n=1 Tax=Sheuella amnicola TaxID=2707330 RepID=A0A6B2R214_9BURK|nr:(d)CMP kinase [Sheuella amnicola]NDY83674.1 (d)CMP kinase [Sheuella amnicola]NDY83677.1 (d)CMP kinase [Sheuella amnicola]
MTQLAPVITIDGPTASGKGTVAHRVASALGFSVLDSGALYRLTALSILNQQIDPDDANAVAGAAQVLQVEFHQNGVRLAGQEVSELIRQEQVGNLASRIAPNPALRAALLDRQRAFRRFPGLVADGRDMGTIVFPDAKLKIFLVASAEARAQRRCNQLIEKGISANLADLLRDMRERDARDTRRAVAPLVPAQGAHTVDSSNLTIDQTVQAILDLWRASF